MIIDAEEIERCFRALRSSPEIVVDVETSGLDTQRNFICGYVFTVGSNREDTWYLPVRHKDGGNIPGCRIPSHSADFNPRMDLHVIERRFISEISNLKKLWIGHNIKFDLKMLARHGIYLYGEVEDTRVNAALLDENQGAYNLEVCAEVMGVDPKDTSIYSYISEYMKSTHSKDVPSSNRSMEFFWWLPGDGKAKDYASQDGMTTWELKDKQHEEISRQELTRVHEVEKRVTRTLFRMEDRGVPVDVEKLEKVEGKIGLHLEEAIKRLPEGMNVRSPSQVRNFMSDKGYTDWPLTEKGNPSFPEEWLVRSPPGQDIISVRKFSNLRNTFINGAIKSNITGLNLIHPDFNQVKADEYGTVSGRLSCSHPNMQQIPKRDKVLAPMLRQVFRPSDPEEKWWSADYSQQEYRVFAEYAESKVVLEAYANNPRTDYHQLVADLLGVERDPAAKRINLGTIYNMGVKKLAESLGVEVQVAQGYMNKMRQMMPEARVFNSQAERVARSRGFVKTILGRRRRFPNPMFSHKAGNAVIQGSSADITKLKMAECDERLMGDPCEMDWRKSQCVSRMILQVHDALDFIFIEEEREDMDEVMSIMQSFGPEDIITLQVPMVADISIGESWGHATFGGKYKDWV